MSQPAQVALIAGGELSRTWFANLAKHQRSGDWLSLVYAPTLRLASRVSNTLRAGAPTCSLEKALACPIVFIRLPEPDLSKLLVRMEKIAVNWRAKILVLCDSAGDSATLRSFEARGAHAATIGVLDTGGNQNATQFVVEGHSRAVAAVHRVLKLPRLTTLRIAKGEKKRFWRAIEIMEYMLPLAIAAEQELRAAGLPRETASALLDEQASVVMRYYRRAGRKGWKFEWSDAIDQLAHKLRPK